MSLVDKYIQDINGMKVLTIMAATIEYGDSMKKAGVKPFIAGVGPIQAAKNTTRILMGLQREGIQPDLIINPGSAGSATLDQGGIYQAGEVGYRDMDFSPFGVEAGTTPFRDYPGKINIAATVPDLPKVSISTGGDVVDAQGSTGKLFQDIKADMIDMETAAILDVANDFGVPMIGLRGISDGKEPSTGHETWGELLPKIEASLAKVYTNIQHGLKAGTISKEQLTQMPPEYHAAQEKRNTEL